MADIQALKEARASLQLHADGITEEIARKEATSVDPSQPKRRLSLFQKQINDLSEQIAKAEAPAPAT